MLSKAGRTKTEQLKEEVAKAKAGLAAAEAALKEEELREREVMRSRLRLNNRGLMEELTAFEARQIEQAAEEKRSDTQDWEEHEALVQERAAELVGR